MVNLDKKKIYRELIDVIVSELGDEEMFKVYQYTLAIFQKSGRKPKHCIVKQERIVNL